MKKTNKGDEYINKFPKFKKWINECSCCHIKGYNPALPEKITTIDGSLEVYFIKKYFKPLNLNENGLCPQCEKVLKNRSLQINQNNFSVESMKHDSERKY